MKKYIILILAFAFLLRLGAVNFGLPYHESFSEELVITATAFKMLAEKSLRADFSFNYLPPLMAYLLTPVFALIGLLGILMGKFQSLVDYQNFVLLYRENFLSAGRVISALFGTASIYFVFLLAKKFFNKKVAFLAGVLLVFDFIHLHESQNGHIWAAVTFFTVAAFYAFLRVYETGGRKWYVWSGIFIGLGYAMGQVPIVFYLPFLLIHILSRPKKENFKKKILNKNFIYATVIATLIFALFTYLNTYSFQKHFYDVIQTISKAFGFKANILPEISKAARFSFGLNLNVIFRTLFYNNPFVFIAALLGFFVLLKKYRIFDIKNIFLIFFPLTYLIFFSVVFYDFLYRYTLPIIPFLTLSASYFVFWLGSKILSSRSGKIISAVLIAVMFGYSSMISVLYTFKLQRGYTLSKGLEWVYKNIPTGSRIVSGTYITPNKESLGFLKTHNRFNWFDTRKSYLMSLNDGRYPEPNYFILNPGFTDLSSLSDEEKKANYIFVAFYDKEGEKIRKEFFNFINGEKELIFKIYPTEDKDGIKELINYQPHFLLTTLFKIKYVGPYVEIYKVL